MKDIYTESYFIFKRNVFNKLRQIHSDSAANYNSTACRTDCSIDDTVDHIISHMKEIMKIEHDKLYLEFQKELVNDLRKVDFTWNNDRIIECAIACTRNDDPEEFIKTITWFMDNNRYDVVDRAVLNNRVEILKWFTENTKEHCTQTTLNFAARNGHLNMVQLLYPNRTDWDTEEAIGWARFYGNNNIIHWLKEKL